jgi:omega-amidase
MMTSSLRIGLNQFNIKWENPADNINALNSLLNDVQDLDLIVLPEMWSTGFTMHTDSAAEEMGGPALSWMIQKAAASSTYIAGSISMKVDGQYFNRFCVVSPQGEIQHYDKRHLFSYGKEDHHYTAGKQQLTFTIGQWRLRAIVCYDLRFPLWCRNTDDYDILLVVANWPKARIHHWDALLRARAIENQCYLVAVNRVGMDGNQLDYNGHSAVVDMNGSTLLNMDEKEGFGKVDLNKEDLTKFRQQYRFLQDRDPFSF